MKKVVYSIRKVRNSNEKLSGLGFINDEGTLLCRSVSKTGKPYTRAFDEVEQHCHPILGKENEFKGYITMLRIRRQRYRSRILGMVQNGIRSKKNG